MISLNQCRSVSISVVQCQSVSIGGTQWPRDACHELLERLELLHAMREAISDNHQDRRRHEPLERLDGEGEVVIPDELLANGEHLMREAIGCTQRRSNALRSTQWQSGAPRARANHGGGKIDQEV